MFTKFLRFSFISGFFAVVCLASLALWLGTNYLYFWLFLWLHGLR